MNQKDMLQSVLRVTGDEERDWTITKEGSKERFASGMKEMQEGNRMGLPKLLYTRVFYPDAPGDFESKGTLNKMLGLPEENVDEATKRAIERSKQVVLA